MKDLAVPLVSLAAPEEDAARVLHKACLEHGFFYLTDHGIPEELIAETFEQQRRFFSLPLEQKMTIAADSNYRGYTPMAEETLDPSLSRRGDTHEGLYYGREVAADSKEARLPLHGPNQWPAEELVPGYRAATEAYKEAMSRLGFRVLRLLGIGLSLGPDHFLPSFSRAMYFLRPLHYSAEKSDEAAGLYGAGAHSDYGMLTFLKTDGVPGLQICMDGATWHEVPPIEGALIVNLGDMLCRWTNGMYRSTLHRVINAGQERYSIPFFFEPNFDAKVEALPQCLKGQDPLFPPTTAGQHLLDKYHATHAGYGKATKGMAVAVA